MLAVTCATNGFAAKYAMLSVPNLTVGTNHTVDAGTVVCAAVLSATMTALTFPAKYAAISVVNPTVGARTAVCAAVLSATLTAFVVISVVQIVASLYDCFAL